ncbi:peptidylprolyl isomerase [bacterium]|nr:peptidylprolyl isomerase [bacterium]
MLKNIIITLILLVSITLFGDMIDRIEVVVNNEIITHQDIIKELKSLENPSQLTGFEPFSMILGELLSNGEVQKDLFNEVFMLETLVAERLILQEAQKDGVDVTDFETEQLFQSIIERNKTTEVEFRTTLLSRGISIDKFKESLKKRSLFERMKQNKVFPKISISDFEMENYYKMNYSNKKTFKVAYLYIKELESATVEEKEANLQKIKEIKEGVESGKNFEELVKIYSDGPFKNDGGELDWMTQDSLETSLEEEIFKLKEGMTTPPMKTYNGYHIFKLLGLKYVESNSFDSLKEEIYQILAYKKWHSVFMIWLDELKRKAYLEYKNENSNYGRGFSWNKWYSNFKGDK